MFEQDFEVSEEDEREQAHNLTTIAILGFMAGLVLWLGGACLFLGGGDDGPSSLAPGVVSTAPAARLPPTRLPDRTSCEEIRGTDYRSETERQWFRANCT